MWICKKTFEEGYIIVKEYYHIVEYYWGSAHEECNTNLTLTKGISAVFHNLRNHDSYLIFHELSKYNSEINVLPSTIKNYLNLTITQSKKDVFNPAFPSFFIDSVHFLNNSLINLVGYLRENDYYHLSQKFEAIVLDCAKMNVKK